MIFTFISLGYSHGKLAVISDSFPCMYGYRSVFFEEEVKKYTYVYRSNYLMVRSTNVFSHLRFTRGNFLKPNISAMRIFVCQSNECYIYCPDHELIFCD